MGHSLFGQQEYCNTSKHVWSNNYFKPSVISSDEQSNTNTKTLGGALVLVLFLLTQSWSWSWYCISLQDPDQFFSSLVISNHGAPFLRII